jgi:hypothetical protein
MPYQSPVIVQSKVFFDWNQDNFTSYQVSFDNITKQGNAIIIVSCSGTETVNSVTDDASGGTNSYSTDFSSALGGLNLKYFSCPNGKAAKQITFGLTGSGSLQLVMMEVSGLALSAIKDQTALLENGYHGGGGTGQPFTSSLTSTTTQAGELAVGFAINIYPGNVTWTDDSPWSFVGMSHLDGLRVAVNTLLSVGTYAYTGTWTLGTEIDVYAAIVTYDLGLLPAGGPSGSVGEPEFVWGGTDGMGD